MKRFCRWCACSFGKKVWYNITYSLQVPHMWPLSGYSKYVTVNLAENHRCALWKKSATDYPRHSWTPRSHASAWTSASNIHSHSLSSCYGAGHLYVGWAVSSASGRLTGTYFIRNIFVLYCASVGDLSSWFAFTAIGWSFDIKWWRQHQNLLESMPHEEN